MKIKIKNLKEAFVIRKENDGSGILSIYGTLLHVNEVTIDIIKYMDEGMSSSEIKKNIIKIYDVDEEVIHKDLVDITKNMLSFGLLDQNHIKKLELENEI